MIGASTTYIVILIQFSTSKEVVYEYGSDVNHNNTIT